MKTEGVLKSIMSTYVIIVGKGGGGGGSYRVNLTAT